ncbi:hypothetical protein N8I77_010973 [Diaporthe amygdali]|uniref:Heterokaryon incompatibility domain-containing protein n=1 Tax=Phomopsis amygdali TaxID=1214568 RepID=A0AAD9S5X7_PHOAM|nr:hypothetical protein N8I77_010973 [Diaporthe amygdali]
MFKALVCQQMATKHDGETALAAAHGSGTFPKRCELCDTVLAQDWPDFSKIDPLSIKNHAGGEWKRAAESGCPFCSIVVSVIGDARIQHGCSMPADFGVIDYESSTEERIKGFQVFLGLNASTGRYLLAIEHVWMPMLGGTQKEFWGTITVYLDELDVLNLNLEPFFEIPRHPDFEETLKFAREWLTTCQNDHPDCSLELKRNETLSAFPHASIRMVQIRENQLRLTPMKLCGTLPPYVALSHCWGSCLTSKTLSSNIESFQIGFRSKSLPATFRDAIKMTKSLGFDHIWIDSLCIIQDDPLDWEEQSSLMALVYGNADLVLAASSASSTDDGLLKERKGFREPCLQLHSVRNQNRPLNMKYRLLQPKHMEPMINPLDQRGWALQERLLARRYLSIGSHDTSWTCMTSSSCECEWWRVATIWRQDVLNINTAVRDARDDELGLLWRRKVIAHYAQRKLTVSSDNLVAISALASLFHTRLQSDYLAGLWRKDLLSDLLWYTTDDAYVSEHGAPSWSWASLPHLLFGFDSAVTGFRQPTKRLVEVLDAGTTLSTANQFASVTSGFIKLRGQLCRAEITESQIKSSMSEGQQLRVDGLLNEGIRMFMDMSLIVTDIRLSDQVKDRSLRQVQQNEIKDGFYIGNLEQGESTVLYLVPLIMTEERWAEEHWTSGLIVTRSQKHPTCFERIGYFNSSPVSGTARNEEPEAEIHEQDIVIEYHHLLFYNHPLNALNTNRDRAAVNCIPPGDLLAHAKLSLERRLVAVVLAVHEPRAAPPPQHRVALAMHPDLVVGHDPGPRHALEQHLAAVGERDRDDRRRRDGHQAPPQQVAQDPGVLEGEGVEGERVAVLLERLDLCVHAG